MFCIGCGNEIAEETIFCPKCGTKQTEGASPVPSKKIDPMGLSNQLMDKLVTGFRNLLSASFFTKSEQFFKTLGLWATPVSALVGLLIAIVLAIKIDSFGAFLFGLLWVVGVAVSYYIGSKFLSVCEKNINNNTSTLGSVEVLDCLGLMFIAALCSVLIGGLYFAIKFSNLSTLMWTMPLTVFLIYAICLLFNPTLISIKIEDENSAGQDALAYFILFWKICLKLAGVVFGGLTAVGAVSLTYLLYVIMSGTQNFSNVSLSDLSSASGFGSVLFGLWYPFSVYVIVIGLYLFVDVCQSIMSNRSNR